MFGSGRRGKRGGECMIRLDLGLTKPVGKRECLTCVCIWVAVVYVRCGLESGSSQFTRATRSRYPYMQV